MPPTTPDSAESITVVETPTGLEIRMRELRNNPKTCLTVMACLVLTSVAGLAATLALERAWHPAWTRTGVCLLGAGAIALAVLGPLGFLSYRMRQVLVVCADRFTLHRHENAGQHFQQNILFATIRRIVAKPRLMFVDHLGSGFEPLREYSEAEQRRAYRLIVDHLLRTNALTGLREIDDDECRIETLEKPALSTLRAEESGHTFRVEIPLPKLLPNERNRNHQRNAARIAGVAAIIGALAMVAFFVTQHPLPALMVFPSFVVGAIALFSFFSCFMGKQAADEHTRVLTQAISVAGDLLVRTTGLGDKQVWRRGEIQDIGVTVSLGTSDSEGASSPDTVTLSVLTWKGRSVRLHHAIFDRGRNETPREEMEWIASQLRLALGLFTPTIAPTPTVETPPSSSAIVAHRQDVQSAPETQDSTAIREGGKAPIR
jgi:hypothetical protein